MKVVAKGEDGQAVVEFGLIGMALLVMTAGLLDVGRAFFQYNELSSLARNGARWASVVGGSCIAGDKTPSASDWCNQLNSGNSTAFWAQTGNKPFQSGGTACPSTYSPSFAGNYQVSSYSGTSATTIVGAIAHHFDTSSSGTSAISGDYAPGIDWSKLVVCIDLPWDSSKSAWTTGPGATVIVHVYAPFQPAGPLLSGATFNMAASAQYVIEGAS